MLPRRAKLGPPLIGRDISSKAPAALTKRYLLEYVVVSFVNWSWSDLGTPTGSQLSLSHQKEPKGS